MRLRMDNDTKTWIEFAPMDPSRRAEKRDGFPQETLYVLPRQQLRRARANPALHGLTVTDAGRFPRARRHLRRRENGCDENIFILCFEGTGFVSVQDSRVELRTGDALTVPAGAPHEYGSLPDDPWTIYWMHITGDFVPVYIPREDMGRKTHVVDSRVSFVVSLFDHLFSLLSRGTSESYLLTATSTAELILGSIYLDNHEKATGPGARGAREIEGLISYIQEHLDETITLDVLKSRSHLSVSRISQLFRDLTRHAPMEFVQHQRIQRACYYLDATDDPVGQIASMVGFDDQFYFSRVFRRITGISPREYRKRLRS